MTSTYLATSFGVSLGLGFTALAYTTVPAYHDALVWSWGLVGIDIVSIFG